MKAKIEIAKKLRRESTDAEKALWRQLRSKRFDNFKFRRQHPIGPYIVDFVCLKNKLVIECDGGQHLDNQNDIHRTRWLETEGYTVLRFWNDHILKDTKAVLESIWEHCHPPPTPPLQGGEV